MTGRRHENAELSNTDCERRRGTPIGTFSGNSFYPLDPDPEDVEMRDIAHGLAHTCRYAGQCQYFYSVGTHSLYVSRELAGEHEPAVQLYGLFHDAAEAYVTDVPRPVKGELDGYERIETGIRSAVWESLGIDPPTDDQWQAVMAADDRLFHYEADTLLHGFQPPTNPDLEYELSPCSPRAVREQFLDHADTLLAATR